MELAMQQSAPNCFKIKKKLNLKNANVFNYLKKYMYNQMLHVISLKLK